MLTPSSIDSSMLLELEDGDHEVGKRYESKHEFDSNPPLLPTSTTLGNNPKKLNSIPPPPPQPPIKSLNNNETEDGNYTGDGGGGISSALILQCGQCRTVVGNTLSICHTDPTTRTISIQRPCPTILIDHDTLHTSMDNFDYGSTYHRFGCRECSQLLGKIYRTTGPELDSLRGVLTFYVDNLLLTELWDPEAVEEQQSMSTWDCGNVPPNAALTVEEKPAFVRNGGDGQESLPEEASFLAKTPAIEILKLQKFCLYLYEKLESLETQLKLKDEARKFKLPKKTKP